MSIAFLLFLLILMLMGTFSLTAVSSALRKMPKREVKKVLHDVGNRFFYRNLHHLFFKQHESEGIFFTTLWAQNITRFVYACGVMALLFQCGLMSRFSETLASPLWEIVFVLLALLLAFIIGEFLPRSLGNRRPELTLRVCSPLASVFMVLAFPFSYPFLKFSKAFSHTLYFDHLHEPQAKVKQEIIDIIQEADIGTSLDAVDRKLIASLLTFRERIAREVMVPRVDVFSLSADVSIKEAAQLLESEGYSRTPVFRDTVDNIIGVLMYKDILLKYMEAEQTKNHKVLDAPIETIVKNVLYTPETKKIPHLLQEFRKKQVHLAIVVDEYGGTEGLVTIEDILEEIVGDISDEYDEEAEEEKTAFRQSDGSWILDARMTIFDLEEQTGIEIPQEGDYDTVGGYLYFRTGTIPAKGFTIYHDTFKLEVLKSTARSVEKVKITPTHETSHKAEG